ncbi:MAG: cation:proton antiporter [Chloroflexi bacterium]|nr:cation:proton antiporter [Chloroflexota bacterium]
MLHDLLAEAVTQAEWILAVLAFVIIVGPMVAERFRLPGMLGLVLGGMVLGPFVVGFLPEGALDAMGGLGILYLMFLAGAELDLNLFARYRAAAITFSLLTFLFPFILAVWASRSVLSFGWPAAILMGAVWASHTLVAYPVVRETGLAANKAVAVAVGATAITDTLALLILALVSGLSAGEGDASGVGILMRLGVSLAVVLAYTMLFLPWLARRFFSGPGQERLQRFVFILGAMASAGLLAELGDIEGIVGAFFAGMGLNRLIPNNGRLMEQTEFFGSALFVPAFLVSVGMLLNPAVLFSFSTIKLALIFAAALVAGKFLAAVAAGWRFKFSWPEIGVIFSLTIAQAAATLASTMVGLRLGLFGDEVVNAVLLVVLFTLVLTSMGALFFGRKVEPDALGIRPLGQSVIVPVWPGEALKRVMALAAQIARADAGTVTPVAVVPEHHLALRSEVERWLQQAEQFGAAATADVEGALRIDTSMPLGVIRELQERDGSFILSEWQESAGLQRFFIGREIDLIGARSPAPMAAVRFATEPIERLVLVVGRDDKSTGYQVDLQIAVGVALRLYRRGKLPLLALVPDSQALKAFELPEEVQVITIAPGIAGSIHYFRRGDLVIVPAAIVQRFIGSRTKELLAATQNVSVLIAAGPHRFDFSKLKMGQESESIISLGKI